MGLDTWILPYRMSALSFIWLSFSSELVRNAQRHISKDILKGNKQKKCIILYHFFFNGYSRSYLQNKKAFLFVFLHVVFLSLFPQSLHWRIGWLGFFTKINIFHGNLPQVVNLTHIINAILVTTLWLIQPCPQFAWQGEVRNKMHILSYGSCPYQLFTKAHEHFTITHEDNSE